MWSRLRRVVVGVALGLVCAYAVFLGAAEIRRAAELARDGKVTEATVESIRKETRKAARGKVHHVRVYTLRYDGHVGTRQIDGHPGPRFQVIYDPRRPDDVRPFVRRHWRDVLDWNASVWLAGGAFVLVTAVGCVAMLVGAIRRRRGDAAE
jgi:hypothetical protein